MSYYVITTFSKNDSRMLLLDIVMYSALAVVGYFLLGLLWRTLKLFKQLLTDT